MRFPAEGLEYGFEFGHGEDHAAVNIELAVIAIHQDAEIIQVLPPEYITALTASPFTLPLFAVALFPSTT